MVQTLNFLRFWGLPFSARNFKMKLTFADCHERQGWFLLRLLKTHTPHSWALDTGLLTTPTLPPKTSTLGKNKKVGVWNVNWRRSPEPDTFNI